MTPVVDGLSWPTNLEFAPDGRVFVAEKRGTIQAYDSFSDPTPTQVVDLGPNLSVTGSLATILWLIALRREGLVVTAWQFLKLGALVMPPALILAVAAVLLGA